MERQQICQHSPMTKMIAGASGKVSWDQNVQWGAMAPSPYSLLATDPWVFKLDFTISSSHIDCEINCDEYSFQTVCIVCVTDTVVVGLCVWLVH